MQISPNVENLINSKIRLLADGLDNKAKSFAAELSSHNSGVWVRQSNQVGSLVMEHVEKCYDGISTILLNEVRRNNNLTVDQIIDNTKKYCEREKENCINSVVTELKNNISANNETNDNKIMQDIFYKNLNYYFNKVMNPTIALRTDDLEIKYQEIQNTLKTRKTAIWGNRGAWWAVIIAAISAAFTLLAFFFKA